MTQELIAALSSPDVLVRVEAVRRFAEDPVAARPALSGVAMDPAAPMPARVWAMIAMCLIGDDDRGMLSHALSQCMSAREAILRRCAIETLGHLRVEAAVAQIARHLTDDEEIPEAWFDDESSPAEAARRALASIGTPAALSAISSA
jgi:HEAT repeat protein